MIFSGERPSRSRPSLPPTSGRGLGGRVLTSVRPHPRRSPRFSIAPDDLPPPFGELCRPYRGPNPPQTLPEAPGSLGYARCWVTFSPPGGRTSHPAAPDDVPLPFGELSRPYRGANPPQTLSQARGGVGDARGWATSSPRGRPQPFVKLRGPYRGPNPSQIPTRDRQAPDISEMSGEVRGAVCHPAAPDDLRPSFGEVCRPYRGLNPSQAAARVSPAAGYFGNVGRRAHCPATGTHTIGREKGC
jgi:hypothetical protein